MGHVLSVTRTGATIRRMLAYTKQSGIKSWWLTPALPNENFLGASRARPRARHFFILFMFLLAAAFASAALQDSPGPPSKGAPTGVPNKRETAIYIYIYIYIWRLLICSAHCNFIRGGTFGPQYRSTGFGHISPACCFLAVQIHGVAGPSTPDWWRLGFDRKLIWSRLRARPVGFPKGLLVGRSTMKWCRSCYFVWEGWPRFTEVGVSRRRDGCWRFLAAAFPAVLEPLWVRRGFCGGPKSGALVSTRRKILRFTSTRRELFFFRPPGWPK